MSNLAQEEADRFFSHRERQTIHPEDREDSDGESLDDNGTTEPAFSENPNDDTDDDDLDISHRMSSLTTTKSSYTVPRAEQYANTGPKGVISDAQSFARAKQSANRKAMSSLINDALASTSNTEPTTTPKPKVPRSGSDSEDEEEEEEDDDDAFVTQWRATRLAELSAASQKPQPNQQRSYGRVIPVDATGYLDAIDNSPPDTTVVVMLYDDSSTQSVQVEDELDMLAYSHGHVRFVKMDHAIAEMRHVIIPALLAYRGGELCATISDAKRDGLEKVLREQGVLR